MAGFDKAAAELAARKAARTIAGAVLDAEKQCGIEVRSISETGVSVIVTMQDGGFTRAEVRYEELGE